MRKFLTLLLFVLGFVNLSYPYTVDNVNKIVTTTGASSDVQAGINAAANDWTVLVPSGSYSWSGLNISGKYIYLKGNNSVINLTSSINVTKNSSGSTKISGFKFSGGGSTSSGIYKIVVTGSWLADPPIIYDCVFNENFTSSVLFNVNGGLIYNCIFNGNKNYNDQAVKVKMDSDIEHQWTSVDTLGTHDTTGKRNTYVENCTFTNLPLQCFDFDGASRLVVRNCTFSDSGITSHGADTSPIGMRQYEIYNNRFIFHNFGDCDGHLTQNIDYFMFIRGGTGVIFSNNCDNLQSCAWGSKNEVKLTLYNINRNGGQVPCQTSYPAYQQIGQGHNGNNYFTDPLYIWGNSSATTVGISAYSPDECGNGQNINNYLQAGRDYILSARPNYTRYPYPHPLSTTNQVITPNPPTNLRKLN